MKTGQVKYQIVIILVLGVYIYYLVYRLRYTINPNALILSLSFFYADVHGFFSMALFSFQLWNPLERKAPPPIPDLSVDIYIPTYNEDISIIRKTILGCSEINYPHKTYILDDGNRPELAKKAAEWGCGYITRKERLHAKAGNLNHALQCTDGEFVVIFDTDCVPQPDFLDKTIGYFLDQKLAFVQTPHNYYNVDSFQFRVNMEKKKSWTEQNLFYRLIMPGRDYWNSAFFAGTAAIFRKKALQDVGGFATGSITEDFHTTINLYSHSWKGIYHNEVLSNELAAKDLKNYHVQQLRWAEGNLSMFFKCNPVFKKGLTIPQRICFFSTIFGWLFGFPKLIYLIMPILAVFLGLSPIRTFDFPFIWRCVFFLVVLVTGFEIVTRGYGKIFYCECFVTMNFFVVIKATFRSILGLFGLKSIFKVTGKGRDESVSIFSIMPQLVIGLFCFCGVAWGGLKLYYEISSGWIGNASIIFWNGVNGLLIFSVVEKITKPYYKRKDFRFIGAVPVRYSVEESTGSLDGFGVTRDINECGISLITFSPLPLDKKILLSLYLDKKILHCKASVLFTHQTDSMQGRMFMHGTKFEDVSAEEMDLINLYCFNTILPRFRYKFGKKSSGISRRFFKFSSQKYIRKHVRKKITLPVVVQSSDKTPLIVVTNDISMSGLSFTSYVPLESGAILTLKTITPFGTLDAEGEIRQAREIVAGHSYFIGVKFIKLFNHAENILLDITDGK
ncbi:MAG TPA: glycosyltransferase [Candidatus Wunengus sp. YC60]|uniref:glycosyltransferase n=1 Tax=Candidatus Wunengus sp. YC60 TaxID=3367697 RepID=UPI0040286326